MNELRGFLGIAVSAIVIAATLMGADGGWRVLRYADPARTGARVSSRGTHNLHSFDKTALVEWNLKSMLWLVSAPGGRAH